MRRILAIETSGRIGSIALADQGCLLAESQFPHGLKHAAHIVSIIDELCRRHDWTPGHIECVCVSAGPGSFTGLRIGVTLAKTLALATGARVVAVPSVRVLVENAPPEARCVAIVLDAKREQIYTALFVRDASSGEWTPIEPAHVDRLADVLARAPRPVHLLGEGLPCHRQAIDGSDPSIVLLPEDSWRARASVVARLGWAMAQRGQFADPYALTPIYIRPPEAEEKWRPPE